MGHKIINIFIILIFKAWFKKSKKKKLWIKKNKYINMYKPQNLFLCIY